MDGTPGGRNEVASRGAGGAVEVVAGRLAARREEERAPNRRARDVDGAPADAVGRRHDRRHRARRADRGPLAVLAGAVIDRAGRVWPIDAYPGADLADVGRPRAGRLRERDADDDALRAVDHRRRQRDGREGPHVAEVYAGRRRVDSNDVPIRPVADPNLGVDRARGDEHGVLEEDAVGLVPGGHRRGLVVAAGRRRDSKSTRAERLRGAGRESARPRRPRVVGEVDRDVGVIPPRHLPNLLTTRRRHPHR